MRELQIFTFTTLNYDNSPLHFFLLSLQEKKEAIRKNRKSSKKKAGRKNRLFAKKQGLFA